MNRNALRSRGELSQVAETAYKCQWVGWRGARGGGEGWVRRGTVVDRVCCKELSQVQRINIYSPAWLTLPTPMTAQNPRKRKVAPVWRRLLHLPTPHVPPRPRRLLQCQPVAAAVAVAVPEMAAVARATLISYCCTPPRPAASSGCRKSRLRPSRNTRVSCAEQASLIYDQFMHLAECSSQISALKNRSSTALGECSR